METKKSEEKGQISINVQNMGLEPIITLSCSRCSNQPVRLPNEYSKYKGHGYNGEMTMKENCSWFAMNIRLVLGTLAAGIGASEAATLLSFLGLPNLQSFSTISNIVK